MELLLIEHASIALIVTGWAYWDYRKTGTPIFSLREFIRLVRS